MAEIDKTGTAEAHKGPGKQILGEERAQALRGEPPSVPEPSTISPLAGALKDAAIAAGIAAALFFFFIGQKTDLVAGGLALRSRWGAFIIAIAIVFAGRLAISLLFSRQYKIVEFDLPATIGKTVGAPLAARFGGLTRYFGTAALTAALFYPFILLIGFPQQDKQFIDLGVLVLTYIMLGWGLNIVVGLAGLLDLGYVAFYAIGAYSFALIAQHFEVGFWIALPIAGMLAAMWGLILGFPVLRLRGDYLAIVTLAFGEIIRIVLLNWYTFTNGPDGISGIPDPTFFRAGIQARARQSAGYFRHRL